ncbi:Flp family type IVb pilin [Vibrio alginolyticus]|uniref:Flp family type IVb pilin n=1 Tax=Vibrio alginolyticus TaxID=663 RepID=UPI001BD6D71C|nr:Flp family type IVb pilin [Vibrio alginolyticus]MBS9896616.1 Flp family type IVb pilin [Vibrio alginolyticus]MBY8205015.1 Flp family type IVb pilin [Vibrio fluvialis]
MLTKAYVKTRLLVESFAKDQRGVTAIEYAIIGVAISAIVLAVFTGEDAPLTKSLKSAFGVIDANLDSLKTK